LSHEHNAEIITADEGVEVGGKCSDVPNLEHLFLLFLGLSLCGG